ncbi:MAG: hypothetical protein JXR40_05110 [Pontiellaceae bacterium]|nr:hypothetical protein [Pontiellaceae bacterium]
MQVSFDGYYGTGDADHDGLSDVGEFAYRTDPTDRDTDDDGFADGPEVDVGINPLMVNDELFNTAVTTLQDDPDLRETHGLACNEALVAENIAADPDKMSAYGLYTEVALRDLYLLAPQIWREPWCAPALMCRKTAQ